MARTRRDFYDRAIPLFILCVLLTPTIKAIIPALPGYRFEDFITAAFVFFVVVGARHKLASALAWGPPQTLLLVFTVFALLSTLVGLLLGFPAALADVAHIGRWVLLAAALTMFATAFARRPDLIEKAYRWLAIGSVGLAAIVVQQYFDLFGLNAHYVTAIAPTQAGTLTTVGSVLPRPVGMAGNPNELGFMCAVLALVFLHAGVTKRGFIYYVLAIGQAVLVVLSASRTSIVALGVGVLIYAVVCLWRIISTNRGRPIVALFLLAIIIASGWTIFTGPSLSQSVLGQRIDQLGSIDTSASWVVRLRNWHENEALFARSPITGVGPLTKLAQTQAAPDNEWLLMLRSYGLLGTLIVSAAFIAVVYSGRRSDDRLLGLALLVATAVYMVPAAALNAPELASLLIVVLPMVGGRQQLYRTNYPQVSASVRHDDDYARRSVPAGA